MSKQPHPAAQTVQRKANREPAGGFKLRPAQQRGMVDHGWLQSAHSFSFGSYHDPEHMGFENLRVINDDLVAGGGGFAPHPHRNAEIFSYVLEGSLEHKDTLGNGSIVTANGIQYMSAGSGVTHSEFNPSTDSSVRFLQVWLQPNATDEAPRYETAQFTADEKDGKLRLILSRDGRDNSIAVKSNADIYAATFNDRQSAGFEMQDNHKAWIQVARGTVHVNNQLLEKGDGLAVNAPGRLVFHQAKDAEILLFELGGG